MKISVAAIGRNLHKPRTGPPLHFGDQLRSQFRISGLGVIQARRFNAHKVTCPLNLKRKLYIPRRIPERKPDICWLVEANPKPSVVRNKGFGSVVDIQVGGQKRQSCQTIGEGYCGSSLSTVKAVRSPTTGGLDAIHTAGPAHNPQDKLILHREALMSKPASVATLGISLSRTGDLNGS